MKILNFSLSFYVAVFETLLQSPTYPSQNGFYFHYGDNKFPCHDIKSNKSFTSVFIYLFLSVFFPSSRMQTVPKVEIVDERGLKTSDKFYKSGSTIELKCVISKIPQPTSYVTWKHGLRMLNYDTSRGGIR